MSKKALTEEQETSIVERYKAGETIPQMAKAFGVSINPIARAIAKAGIVTRQQSTEARLTNEVRAEIAKACANGDKINDVAARYSIGRRTVTQILSDHGVALKAGRPPSK